jgi:RimJ/RimL family protein N-acetyltransferase
MTAPQPAKSPPIRVMLDGRYTRLEPLGTSHVHELYGAASPQRFSFLFDTAPRDESEMRMWVEKAAAGHDPLYYAVIDRSTGRVEGRQALMRIVPEHGVIEVGGILWGDRIARTRVATEALFLHASYVFDDLGYRRFEWKCNALNQPSRNAAIRFGFRYEGTFRQHMIVKGQNRDTAWFAMLDGDWPRLKKGYQRWLDPANFDANGGQKTKLKFDPA